MAEKERKICVYKKKAVLLWRNSHYLITAIRQYEKINVHIHCFIFAFARFGVA